MTKFKLLLIKNFKFQQLLISKHTVLAVRWTEQGDWTSRECRNHETVYYLMTKFGTVCWYYNPSIARLNGRKSYHYTTCITSFSFMILKGPYILHASYKSKTHKHKITETRHNTWWLEYKNILELQLFKAYLTVNNQHNISLVD